MFALGTRLRSTWNPMHTGIVVGYGNITKSRFKGEPDEKVGGWYAQEYQPTPDFVYLVWLDKPTMGGASTNWPNEGVEGFRVQRIMALNSEHVIELLPEEK